ncbi:transposase [Pseudomonas aeruginosa]|nr:transposase [Pseudomonas aeruginosa]
MAASWNGSSGTAMQMIHDELPGTTFSNPDQRGDYDSENKAALTLRELERWLTLAVGTYHGSVHNGLLQPPAARWAEAVARVGVPAVVTRATSFLVDFLPILRRTLTRTGFVIRPHPLLRRCAQAVDCRA